MVNQRSWVHVLSVISRGCVWEINVWVVKASSNGRWRSARSQTSTSYVMSSWRNGRGLQWQPLMLWWTPCPRGLRQCWKIIVATQNIDTLGHIWTFSLRGVLTFVASVIDVNGCVSSYFEGTANLSDKVRVTWHTTHDCSRAPQSWYWRWRECCTFTPPTYNSCRPEIRTSNLSIMSPTL